MRHRKEGRKFHRLKGRRVSFLKNLTLDVIQRGHIETTEIRAKAIRPRVERLVTIAKRGTLADRRLLLARLYNNKRAVKLLCDEIAPRYASRAGGYLRIKKSAKVRKRDGSSVATIEFV